MRASNILRGFDEDMRNGMPDAMTRDGIVHRLGCLPTHIENQSDGSLRVTPPTASSSRSNRPYRDRPLARHQGSAFNERAVPGQFIERKIKEGNDQRQLVILQGLSGADFAKRLTQAYRDAIVFQLAFYSNGNYSIKEIMRVAGDKLNIFPVYGDLQYCGMRSQEAKSIPISGTSILYEDNRRECAARYPFLHG